MKLIRYSHPHHSFREWDALFANPFRSLAPLLAPARQTANPGVEWFEDDTHYHARIELPGLKRENLRLDAEEGLLRISHETLEKGEGESTRTSRSELVVRCPEGIRGDGIEARLADGILHLSLPKEEARKPVSVEIR